MPFLNAQEAWFWTMRVMRASRSQAAGSQAWGCAEAPGPARPGTPEEVLRCLDRLYRQRRIDLLHARILKIWGERGRAPDPNRRGERCDAPIWQEAIARLEWPLRVRGIVAGPRER